MKTSLNKNISIQEKNGVLYLLNKSHGILVSVANSIGECHSLIQRFIPNNQLSLSSFDTIRDFPIIEKLLRGGILTIDAPVILAPITKVNASTSYLPHFKKSFYGADVVQNIEVLSLGQLWKRNSSAIEISPSLKSFLNVPVDVQKHERMIQYKPTGLTILLTSKCNLGCTYCYSNSGEAGTSVSFDQAIAAIDIILQSRQQSPSQPISISFLGGGEPTVEWNLLNSIVNHCRRLEQEKGVRFKLGITTNGTLDESKGKWIAQHFENIKVSFDGIESVHNKQRPSKTFNSYQKTYEFMRLLTSLNKKFNISMTLSEDYLEEVEKSLDLIEKNLTPETVLLTPIFQLGRATGCHGNFTEKSMVRLIKIRAEKANAKFKIVIPQDQMLNQNYPKESFCGFQRGKIYLTPSGHITTCPKVDNSSHPHFSTFNVGTWEDHSSNFNFDFEKFETAVKQSLSKSEKSCSKCPISNFCAGVCYLKDLQHIQRSDCIKTKHAFHKNMESALG